MPSYLKPEGEEKPIESTTLSQLEAKMILAALRKNKWNRQSTAVELGMHKTTLWRKIKRYNIKQQH